MANILKATKNLYSCFTDKNGRMLEQPTGSIGRMELPEEHLRFLRRYLELMLNSTLLNKTASIYIRGTDESAGAVFETWNRTHPQEQINKKTAASNLDYCRRKLINGVFDEDILTRVVYYSRTADMPRYWSQLEAAAEKYSRKGALADTLMLTLPKTAVNAPVDESDIRLFLADVARFRVAAKRKVEKDMADTFGDTIAYINYLAAAAYRTPQEDALWQEIRAFLEGNDD